MSILAVIVACLCLLHCIQSEELQIISNSKAKTVGDVLYINWNVNTSLHDRNTSSPVYFQVHYCPLNMFLEGTNCLEVNITLCNATYRNQPYISANILARQDELQDYVKTSRRGSLFPENSSATIITGKWNETSGKFTCALHNIDECWSVYDFPDIKGQILITASNVNIKEKVLLDVKQNKAPSKYLNRPSHITLVQRSRNNVTVGWKACGYDNPMGFNITFHDDRGKILKCGPVLNKEDFYLQSSWKHNCKFSHLRPYTNYSVRIYSYNGLKLHQSCIPGIKTFRTDEQAPSRPPSFECVVCNEHILQNGNRIVNVRWKLPPKETFNGMVRQTKLKYWAKNASDEAKIITYRNITTKGSIVLKLDKEYFVQVKICTLEQLCSDYHKPTLIPKRREMPDIVYSTGNSKILVITLVTLCPLIIVLAALGALYWRKQNRVKRKQKNNPLEDLESPSEISDSKSNLGYSRKDSVQSSDYSELPLDVPEVEKYDHQVLSET